MTSENIIPQVWLSKNPLLPTERVYAVISNASNVAPLNAFYQQEATTEPGRKGRLTILEGVVL